MLSVIADCHARRSAAFGRVVNIGEREIDRVEVGQERGTIA
jgi:hypothetical protein